MILAERNTDSVRLLGHSGERILVMRLSKGLIGGIIVAAAASSVPARAAPQSDWGGGFAQGYEEHIVQNGPGNSLNISCDVSASPAGQSKNTSIFIEIIGKSPPPKSSVDIFVKDEVFRFPTDERGTIGTDCHVCSDNFKAFWTKLRKAKVMVVQLSDGRSSRFKTSGAAKSLAAKPCTTGFP